MENKDGHFSYNSEQEQARLELPEDEARENTSELEEAACIFYHIAAERIKEAVTTSFYRRRLDPTLKAMNARFCTDLLKRSCLNLYKLSYGDFEKFLDLLAAALLQDKWTGKSFNDYVKRFIRYVSEYRREQRKKMKRKKRWRQWKQAAADVLDKLISGEEQ